MCKSHQKHVELSHEVYMDRCIELAKSYGSQVGKNPNVGALLVYNDQIIGEGAYEIYGGKHAEINAIKSVQSGDKHLIPKATLYVTLEPCNIYGKTPPCSERIITENIKNLVIGCTDPNPRIAGSSLAYLSGKGVQIKTGIREDQCKQLIEPFTVNILKNRPFVTLKVAQSKDFFTGKEGEQVWITNEYSKIYSHKLRSENDAILVGTNTAVVDNPALTNRLYTRGNPLRVVIDRSNRIPSDHRILTDDYTTLVINTSHRTGLKSSVEQWQMEVDLGVILERLYQEKNISRLLIEGGSFTIQKFLDHNLWDCAVIFTATKRLHNGIKAPNIIGSLIDEVSLGDDTILWISSQISVD